MENSNLLPCPACCVTTSGLFVFIYELGWRLHCRLRGTGVESFVCHPGMTRTDVFRKADHDKMASIITDWMQWIAGQTAESGALPLLYCATAPELQGGCTHMGRGCSQRCRAYMLPMMVS